VRFQSVTRRASSRAQSLCHRFTGRCRIAVTLLLIASPVGALRAQHATDNPVASADDAFGLTIGLETIGMYGPNSVRGFNPQAAGNVRIDGLYFDQQGALSNRVVEGSTIRVGVSEVGYAFPAPTGIVDYDLRHPGDGTPKASVVASDGPFAARGVSADGNIPLIGSELQLPIGASYQVNSQTPVGAFPGYTAAVVNVGATPQWKPSDRLTVRAIFDWTQTTNADTMPVIFTAGNFLPPDIARRFLGQNWAQGRGLSENYGGLLDAKISQLWTLTAGLFRSVSDNPYSYSDLYLNAAANGLAEHWLVGYPDQSVTSTSGEMRLTGHFLAGSWSQNVVLLARGRDTQSSYGGGDAVNVGTALIGEGAQLLQPRFIYSARTEDHTQLWSAGLAYRAQWDARADFALGLQRESYDKRVTPPDAPIARLSDNPLRGYASAAATLTSRWTAYASYTQGLEDSGVAPNGAENRGAILPATRTWQADAGVRWLLTPKLKLIAGIFEISKPYFNLDTNNVDRELGVQQARGMEFSLSGELINHLNVTAGALLGRVTIIGSSLNAEGVGRDAFGQPRDQGIINADYSFPKYPAVSLDLTLIHIGATPASVNDAVLAPTLNTLSVGSRYRFSIRGAPATLRLQAQNLNNAELWTTAYTPGFYMFPPRSVFGYLTVDI
jgi:iron complex outermembrane receptor protein